MGNPLESEKNKNEAHRREFVETALAKSEETLRLLVDAVEDYAIFVLDPAGNILTWNAGANRLIGYTPQEAIGSHFSRFYTEEDLARNHPAQELKQAIQRGRYEEEGWRVKKDGSRFWSNVVITALKDSRGQLVGFGKVTRDLTERKRAEEAVIRSRDQLEVRVQERTQELAKTNEDLKRVLDAQRFLSDASAVLNTSLEFGSTLNELKELTMLANSQISDWCSVSLLENGRSRTVALAHPDAWSKHSLQQLERLLPQSWNSSLGVDQVLMTGRSELRSKFTTGDLTELAQSEAHRELLASLEMKSVMIVPMLARGKILGAISFISCHEERIYTRLDLEVAEELARRAGGAIDNAFLFQQSQEAVRARDEFLSIASHELKTPLTSLKLQAQIRKRNLEQGQVATFSIERMRKFLQDDDKQINRMTRLIDDMLDVSRLTSGKLQLNLEPMDLSHLVREVLDRFSLQLEHERIEVILDVQPEVRGQWDRYRVEQIFINLLTNAMKYGNGSPIAVSVRNEGGFARLQVSDQGPGISNIDQARIFQQFERVVSSTNINGLGLGLYIVKQLVDAHGGVISVESEIGKGAAFTVKLPHDLQMRDAPSYRTNTSVVK